MDEDKDDSDALAEIERQKLFQEHGWTEETEREEFQAIAKPDGLDIFHLVLDIIETAEAILTKKDVLQGFYQDPDYLGAWRRRKNKVRNHLRRIVKHCP